MLFRSVDQMQLLVFSALAFAVLMRTGIYPPELRSVNLDFDWFYRRLGRGVVGAIANGLSGALGGVRTQVNTQNMRFAERIYRHRERGGLLARTRPTGSMALWMMVMLLAYLLLYYV